MIDFVTLARLPAWRASGQYLLSSTALGLVMTCAGGVALAQSETGQSQMGQTAPVQMETISVEGETGDEDFKVDRASSPRYSQPIVDTPKTITIVPQALLQERAADSLTDALRNVSGISLVAGEGGTPDGDNLTLRGFSARTDIFVDGLRDIGGYSRDTFNLESVEVVKGPSGTENGRGSTGGSVNLVTKTPTMETFQAGTLTLGTDDYKRGTADLNFTLDALGMDDAAFRINVMGTDNDVPGRDNVENTRWGVAPSIAFGLGTDTEFTLSYLHLEEDNMPDHGHPFLNGEPVDVDRNVFYGIEDRDYEEIGADIVTAKLTHELTDALTIVNQSRYGRVSRDAIITTPRINATPGLVTREGRGHDSVDTIYANQTALLADFTVGGLKNSAFFGVDLIREEYANDRRSIPDATPADMFAPNFGDPFDNSTITPRDRQETTADTVALSASNTLSVTDWLDLSGGLRWESFSAETDTIPLSGPTDTVKADDQMLSWQAGIVVKPTQAGSVYFSYGTSYNPSAESLNASASTADLDPEKNESYELGTKWELFDDRLLLDAAVFRIDKTNGRTSEGRGAVTVLDGKQRVQGFEIGLAGDVTPEWHLFGGYTYLDSEILSSANPDEVGKNVQSAPPHTVSFWTSYDLPWDVTIGGGAHFVSERFVNNTNTNSVPASLVFDAMASYAVTETVSLQLNVLNLTDEEYYDQAYPAHAVPGAGRSVLVSTAFKF